MATGSYACTQWSMEMRSLTEAFKRTTGFRFQGRAERKSFFAWSLVRTRDFSPGTPETTFLRFRSHAAVLGRPPYAKRPVSREPESQAQTGPDQPSQGSAASSLLFPLR